MPGFDGTGPQGRGPMTGRAFGKCRPVYQAEQPPAVLSGENPFPVPAEKVTESQPPVQEQTLVYGVGRGGIPCGCGRGSAFGRRGERSGRNSR
ncbi:MAG: DUF5320 domain-containing protein [Methanobacteriota archaeon]